MISAKELRDFSGNRSKTGFTIEEVNKIINSAADTIEAQENEKQKLYHQRDVLAENIEKYRAEEDSIKTALITAQKMADRIKKDSTDEANKLINESKQNANNTVASAKAQAEKIINEAREYSNSLINQKKQEADSLIIEAEKKSNEAINSSQIVAQNILDQAKEISDELIKKSQDEKEAYEQLSASLAGNAEKFIANLKNLYTEQLNALNSAKIFTSNKPIDEEKLNSVKGDVDSLVDEIGDMKKSIPKEVKIEKPQVEETPVKNESQAAAAEISESEEDKPDPMAAVKAFSTDEMTPIDKSKPVINEISEEAEPEDKDKSLFDDKLPFENYFHINNEDAHLDKTQTISLISPEEQNEGEEKKQPEHKKKGLFKKKK